MRTTNSAFFSLHRASSGLYRQSGRGLWRLEQKPMAAFSAAEFVDSITTITTTIVEKSYAKYLQKTNTRNRLTQKTPLGSA